MKKGTIRKTGPILSSNTEKTMFKLLISPSIIQACGLAGSLAAVLGCLAAAIVYKGKHGERYSLLNHFISELGEPGVSRLAWAFNLGLILCGLLLLPASIGLGLLMPGLWPKLAMLAGCIAAVSVALVGFYPMNNLTPHIRAAMTFFRSGLAMVLLFSIAIYAQPAAQRVLPLPISLVGAPAAAAYTFFLVYSRLRFSQPGESLSATFENRPTLWILALSEWLIFLTTIPWFFAVAMGLSPS